MKIKGSSAVVGVFSYLDDTLKAIQAAKDGNYEYRVFAPVPIHEIEEATFPQKSPVRGVSLVGGIFGFSVGFFMAIICALDYPLRVSAKEIISIPGFFVIGYECTILLGALFTLMALFYFCRLPDILRKVGYDPRFSRDKFGVVIACPPDRVEQLKSELGNAGAEEVEVRDAL